MGVNRLLLAFLCEGLVLEDPPAGSSAAGPAAAGASRLVLRLHERLAPYKAAVLPVVKNKAPLVAMAEALHGRMLAHLPVEYDATQSIGKRYRRQDEIGTPLCVTLDTRSLEDGTVTVRCRDTMAQVRLHADEVVARCERNAFSRAALADAFAAGSESNG